MIPYLQDKFLTVLNCDVLDGLQSLPNESVHCIVTSPPYWGLRDYKVDGQIGLERTPTEYIAKMVAVFNEVKRVLRKDGTAWVNMGDTYATSGGHSDVTCNNRRGQYNIGYRPDEHRKFRVRGVNKNLCGMPWRLAFALQANGWYLRSDIIWHKPSPMPESVQDRPTKSHEYIFLLTKSARYYYDAEAIKEPCTGNAHHRGNGVNKKCAGWATGPGLHSAIDHNQEGSHPKVRPRQNESFSGAINGLVSYRNKRSVWTVPSQPFKDAHFATFPPDLIKPCILAGTSERGCCAACGSPWKRVVEKVKGQPESFNGSDFRNGKKAIAAAELADVGQAERTVSTHTTGWTAQCDCQADVVPCTVLDPFAGTGTTGMVSNELGRQAVLIELSIKYCEMIKQRTRNSIVLPLCT